MASNKYTVNLRVFVKNAILKKVKNIKVKFLNDSKRDQQINY